MEPKDVKDQSERVPTKDSMIAALNTSLETLKNISDYKNNDALKKSMPDIGKNVEDLKQKIELQLKFIEKPSAVSPAMIQSTNSVVKKLSDDVGKLEINVSKVIELSKQDQQKPKRR